MKAEPARVEFLSSGAVLAAKETTLTQLKIAPVPMSLAVVKNMKKLNMILRLSAIYIKITY